MAQRARLVLVDEGVYREETIPVPDGALDRYDRLIDYLREDPDVLKHVFVDLDRLCGAFIEEDEEA